jgi:hypothetical protein
LTSSPAWAAASADRVALRNLIGFVKLKDSKIKSAFYLLSEPYLILIDLNEIF